MSKREAFFSSVAFLFIGIVIGFWFSPAKNGVYCGNNNGDRYGISKDDYCDWDEDEDEDELKF